MEYGICTEAYEAWSSLFNENAADAWFNERRELRKVAMILVILDLEFKSIQKDVENEFITYKKKFYHYQQLKHNLKSLPHLSKTIDKENVIHPNVIQIPGIVPLPINVMRSQKNNFSDSEVLCDISETSLIPSSEFKFNQHLATSTSSCDEVETEKQSTSPKINKGCKFSRLKRPRDMTNSSSLLDIVKTPELIVSPSFNNTPNNKCLDNDDIIESTPIVKDDTPKYKCQDNNDMIESTIIDVTPEFPRESKKGRYSKFGNIMNRKKKSKSRKCNKMFRNSTLTQMFSNVTTSTTTEATVVRENDDIDPTYCQPYEANISVAVKNNIENVKAPIKPETDTTLITATSVSKQMTYSPRKADIVYKMKPVRGKERMKLEGWDCDDCKRFYDGLGTTPSNAKILMNKCSRHRNKYKPEPDTIAGFWKLDFTPTQRNSDNDSTVFDI